MKRLLIGLSLALNLVFVAIAVALVMNVDSLVDNFLQSNRDRLSSQFEVLSGTRAEVVFLGDSITQGGRWSELFPGSGAVNRGIGGDTTADVLARLDQVLALEPAKLFVMIGINDLNRGLGPDTATANYQQMFDRIDAALPDTRVFLQSVLPVNDDWAATNNTHIPTLNAALLAQASARGYTYIDLNSAFSGPNGQLRPELSNDGIHLMGKGYALWREQIQSLVMP